MRFAEWKFRERAGFVVLGGGWQRPAAGQGAWFGALGEAGWFGAWGELGCRVVGVGPIGRITSVGCCAHRDQSWYFGAGGVASPSVDSQRRWMRVQVPSERMRSRVALTKRTRSSSPLGMPMP
ncbi:hypothetical protein FNL39_101588 [Nocardia caishijiensis]|uniref:Uncharacterized protein n=1 Tax=Nocardia caishijiensis TaxID=184756 RepID=A0ABQ6YTL1_9NOCA|nr:hypothetical protein FNL39_101588 [Nocardia caishijiensis]